MTVVDSSIKFIGTSEKMDGLDVFHPDRMLLESLNGMYFSCEPVSNLMRRKLEKFQKKIKNTFGFDDFLKQIQQIKDG